MRRPVAEQVNDPDWDGLPGTPGARNITRIAFAGRQCTALDVTGQQCTMPGVVLCTDGRLRCRRHAGRTGKPAKPAKALQ
jgi:hypothetical protein